MTLSPGARKVALIAHVTASVGWLGAVVAFLGLSIVSLTSSDAQLVRGAYLAMEATGRSVLVPLSLASLLTGLVQSLGTRWGLFRHYWVVIKLCINVVAGVVLVLYMQTLDELARLASQPSDPTQGHESLSPVLHAAAAIVLLLVATSLSVLKPRGLTRYGRRHQRRQPAAQPPSALVEV